jgi:hypothetical protein
MAPNFLTPFARRVEALEGATPCLFRPMYGVANMGHPSREAGLVVSSQALILDFVFLTPLAFL